jgi:hypothetical protein
MPNPSLSKIKLNGVEYELEDTVARAATEQMADEIAGISGAVSSVNGKTGAVVLDANDVGALPNDTPIPAAVTEQTVSNWGFTKNTGTYSKPSGGIPDSDIASAEAWNAKGTYSKPSDGIPASDLAAGVIPDISGKANAADVYTKTEVDQKLVGAMDYKGTKATVSALPTSGNETGDVWHITADGSEWAWNGSAWEELGSAVDLSGYRTASAQDTIDAAQDSAIAAKYTKPSGGIPKSDLASAVQTSLEKADTAIQSVPNTYRTAAAQDLIDEAQDARINQKVDASALAKVATTGSYNDLSNKPTIPNLNGYATETWVTEKGYQTATQVQTAISSVR